MKKMFDAIFKKLGYLPLKEISEMEDSYKKEVSALLGKVQSQGFYICILKEKESMLFYLSDIFHNKKGRDCLSSEELNSLFVEARLYTRQYGGIHNSSDMQKLKAFNEKLSIDVWRKAYGNDAPIFFDTAEGSYYEKGGG